MKNKEIIPDEKAENGVESENITPDNGASAEEVVDNGAADEISVSDGVSDIAFEAKGDEAETAGASDASGEGEAESVAEPEEKRIEVDAEELVEPLGQTAEEVLSESDSSADEDESGKDDEDESADALPSPKDEENESKEEKPKRAEKERTSLLNSAFDFLEMFVFTLVAVLVITSFIIRPSVVSGDSMQDTLEDGQMLLVSDFLYTPKKGDIVVVEDYATVLKKPIVKRVIATEGDIVRVTRTAIMVNGEVLDEPYVRIDYPDYQYSTMHVECYGPEHEVRLGRDFYEITVPEGELFVLGDHRNASKDSRDIGTVDRDAVIGKVVIRVLPFELFGAVE